MNVPMSEIELTVSCKSLKGRDMMSKSDPLCVLFMKQQSNYQEVDRTERLENVHNPEFAHKFKLNYYFEESQRLKFEIYDVDSNSNKLSAHDFLGRHEITLGEIVGAPGSKVHRNLSGLSKGAGGSIIIAAEEIGTNKEVVHFQMKGIKLDKKDFLGKSDPFLCIYRIGDDKTRSLAHRTEVIDNNLNPIWKPFKVSMRQLCHGSRERPILIDCFDSDADGGQAHDLIGSCQVTFTQLSQPGVTIPLINPKKQAKKKGYKDSGQLSVVRCEVKTEHTFLDYVRGGTQIHNTVAVDFTASNGTPTQPESLHYIHPHQPNQYMVALKAVGEIIQDYDSSKRFPALGFGARMPNGVVSHEFFLNFHPVDPHCNGIDGVLSAYRQAIMSVTLYGPTNFSPVIYHVAKFAAAAARDGSHYFVLLIITDGAISDLDQTKAAIVHASTLPMSIIIVGVGNANFDAMDVLDCDKGRLSVNGRYAERDIVQFVPFRKYQAASRGDWMTAQAQLAKEVLKEIPAQLVQWMQMRGIQAKPPTQVDVSKMEPPPPAIPQDGGDTGSMGLPAQMGQMTVGGGYPPMQQNIGGQFPPQQQPGGHTMQNQGYPPSQQGYPPQQIGYAPQQPGHQATGDYPPQQTGYPPQQPGYPSQQPGHQATGNYPPQQQGAYPPQQGGYQQHGSVYPPQTQNPGVNPSNQPPYPP